MPAVRALRKRSSVIIRDARRGRRPLRGRASRGRLLQRLLVRIDDAAGLVLLRPQNDALAGLVELRDVRALDALELHLEHPRRGPLAVGPELDLADDRVELVLVDVVDDLRLIEALRRLDGLPEHLQ